LADLARKSSKDVAAAAAKRVLTDDDVPHSILTPSPSVATAEPTQSAPPDDIKMDIEPAQKIAERFANKSQSQLANEAAGDVKFPDRDAWEQKLYGQAQ
jgi:hypothetical protein